MDSDAVAGDEVVFEFLPVFRVFQSGRVERLFPTDRLPPSTDPLTGVQSKDILIDPQTQLSVRIYLPHISDSTKKLPLLIYIHGGAFAIGSVASPIYHPHLISLAAESNAVAVSVEYRLAPENPLPAAYDDAWAAVEWAASHSNGDGAEIWLNQHADFSRVFVIGDSAGANISYNVVDRASESDNGPKGMKIIGLGLVHPFFMIDKPDKLIEYVFPTSAGLEDPRMNPWANPRLGKLRCERVLILAAELDSLKDRARGIHAALRESGFEGSVEIEETEGKDHVFHLLKPETEKAVALVKKIASFTQSA
ncbi:probable carboxylesterase 2 [Benincasa hispida]|uniref:probable carboxylesterase 2 n=1 Tax=Benincasa hispida TaxID=102211 RepID=UPI0018FFD6D2|nr:probable carboxylesterase 2 [Benincasa hispida]XP_038900485.1 probable carboxylesterase 2 [Benincasa hispida]XP_038900486.1 probable carboxylesterase 2 [Benincasa hispida]XP_038900487.1 probable carboxylesterase 2 [Benincasa hispida]XP_038900488.1 probable carboxylesterase 2 [Benincasa hispida]XP_038900490.1 probable carboxylesterase 2 [Benincasa hispida]